ncbi:MAG: hypothetical protein J5895_03705 [Alphaproteobacteria bacterium]|nr:hypothetical protein [Alphaproteobacteria bacterium]
MLQRIGKLIKFVLICVLWSAFWLALTRQIVLAVWNFDYASKAQWHFVGEFWRRNGTIQSFSDYMLFLTLFLIALLWYKGLKHLYQTDYAKFFLKPFEYFSKKQIEKYENESKHVVIKNLVVGEKMTLDELIDEKIKEENAAQSLKEADNLRQTLSQKIIERKGK